jgi:hypothetical protein
VTRMALRNYEKSVFEGRVREKRTASGRLGPGEIRAVASESWNVRRTPRESRKFGGQRVFSTEVRNRDRGRIIERTTSYRPTPHAELWVPRASVPAPASRLHKAREMGSLGINVDTVKAEMRA